MAAGAVTAATVLLVLVGAVVVVGLVAAAIAAVLPSLTEAMERLRIEREAAEASWDIHARATEAFGQMLDLARRERGDRS